MKRLKSILFFLTLIVTGTLDAQNAAPAYQEISLPNLMEKLKKGEPNMVVVDVRTPGEYNDTSSRNKHLNMGRIRGTINLDENQVLDHPEKLDELNSYKDKDLYVICSHSYRSRVISRMLLQKGFTHVYNVQGGMSEWFRIYDQLQPYRSSFYETSVAYNNISPAQFYRDQQKDKLLIGISNPPKFFWDSSSLKFSRYFPGLKGARYFTSADTGQILELAKKASGKPIVLFNIVGTGGAETAEWLSAKGMKNIFYLTGNEYGLYEYCLNEHRSENWQQAWKNNSTVTFVTAANLCADISRKKNLKLIDTRHDSLFQKINKGIKHNYKHLSYAINFPAYKPINEFKSLFPDKEIVYVMLTQGGSSDLELAESLSREGYKIQYLMGGYPRWEWYVNNVDGFDCGDLFE